MTKVTIDNNVKKEAVVNMSRGDVFICNYNCYMFIDFETIIDLSDFVVLNINDFHDEKKYIVCDAEIIVHNVMLKL